MTMRGSDPRVKKTLLRNYESKVRPSARTQVIHDVTCLTVNTTEDFSQKENELEQPTLCSSVMLASYLSEVKKSQPLSTENVNNINGQLGSETSSTITKKLNFHFNDKIYKNLIELNANMEEVRSRKDKKPTSSSTSIRKDIEPNIEDFYEDEKEIDSPPTILIPKLKFRPIQKVENGELHKLVAGLEDL